MDSFRNDHAILMRKFGKKQIDKARPYYEALMLARKAHAEVRHAAKVFEKVSGDWAKAKEAVAAAEDALGKGASDVATLDQLSNSVELLSAMEERRRRVSVHHGVLTQAFLKADGRLMVLAKTLKQSVIKTRPYFESKVVHNKRLMGNTERERERMCESDR